jgi:methyl-accepting chemotaxis protein
LSWFYNLKITGKLAVSFGFLLIVLAVQTATVWTNLAALKQNQSWTEHTYKVLGQTDGLISGMVNQETGLRGYLIAGNPKFLEPLEAGRREYETAFAEVKKLTADNPAQQDRLTRLDRFASDWERNIADRQIALMRNPATQGQARQLEASGAGKQAMDGLRGIAKDIRDEELKLLGIRSENAAAARESTRRTVVSSAASTRPQRTLTDFGLVREKVRA